MKILVGVDDSAYSNAAIRHVASATWPASARFVVVSIFPWPIVMGSDEAAPAVIIEKLLGDREKQAKRIAEKAAAQLTKAGLKARPLVASGDPRFVLVDTAAHDGTDLIVVGTHGRTGVKKLLLGSVASHVVSHAPCSVLVVRKPRR
jgi:nucleotide-binding universal stress UspA family protein